MASETCPYLSSVKATVACPNVVDTVFGSIPFYNASVAYVWRRSWKRTWGNPMALTILLKLLYSVLSLICPPIFHCEYKPRFFPAFAAFQAPFCLMQLHFFQDRHYLLRRFERAILLALEHGKVKIAFTPRYAFQLPVNMN